MRDIDDPVLRRQVLALCSALVDADPPLADGESLVLLAAVKHWGLTQAVLQAPAHGLTA